MPFESLFIDDFSKGLDLVSPPSKIDRGYTPNAKNYRIRRGGEIEKTLGYILAKDVGADVTDIFYYDTGNVLVIATGSTWYSYNVITQTLTSIRSSVSPYAQTFFFQHEDDLYGINPLNNLGKWSGSGSFTTYAPGVNSGPPKGVLLGVWANRMWVSTGTSMRVNFSEAGVLTGTGSWPTDNYVTLGGGTSTSEYIVGGMPSPDGLFVFTHDSVYLIYDGNTGANRLVSADIGTVSSRTLQLIGPYIYGLSSKGVFRCSATGLEIISDRIAPLFWEDSPANLSSSASAVLEGNYLVSYSRNDDLNLYADVVIEMNPKTGSFMLLDIPATSMTVKSSITDGSEQLYFVDGTDIHNVMAGFYGDTFAGSPITAYYETPMDPLGDESRWKRLRRLRLVGHGTLDIEVLVDYGVKTGTTDVTAASGATFDGEWFGDVAEAGRRFGVRITDDGGGEGAVTHIADNEVAGSLYGSSQLALIEFQFTRSNRSR